MGGSSDLGKLVLRLTVGGLMLFHGIDKITNGIAGVEGALEAKDLPTFLAYGVYVGEIVAPALLIIGFQTRLAALVLAINMAMAVYLVHMDDLTLLGYGGAWKVELQAFYLLSALSIALIGPGKIAIDGRKKPD